MELIVKVTSRCDMCCTFCSATKLGLQDMTPEEIAYAAKTVNAQTLILLGGEALCMGSDFYRELLELTNAKLDFTTNLKAFHQNTDTWTPLFKHKRVNVCTSFNYGTSRMLDANTIYDENRFCDTMYLFNEKVGYMPPFIAVMDENNINTWRQHIELAKKLGTTVRLNNALKLGRQGKYFPRSKMFKIWVQIAKEGLDEYEINTKERNIGRCPINSCQLCSSTIRVVQKNKNGELIFYNCDDRSNMGCLPLSHDKITDIPHKEPPLPMFNKCYSCDLFHVCNGCQTNLMQIEDKEEYCHDMESIKEDIIKLGWKLC